MYVLSHDYYKENGPRWCSAQSTASNPEKGGELMDIYTLEVELLEEKIAPLGARVGSG